MRRLDWLLLLVVGLPSSAWCLTAARQLGPTFDEPFYLDAGLELWRDGKPGKLLAAGTMPLAPHLQTLPLYLAELATGHRWNWERDTETMLVVARSVTLVFWWVLLLYTLRLGNALGGPLAGRLAVLLLGLEPTFLAHATLATTDLSLAACLMVFVYHFRAGRELGWGWRVGLPTLLFAVAMLAKASTLTFGPLIMLAVELERLARDGTLARAWQGSWREKVANLWRDSRQLRRDGIVIFTLGMLLVVVYCRSDGKPLPTVQRELAKLPPDHFARPFLQWAGGLPLWPNGLHAIWYQVKHNLLGHHTYLIGYESPRSLWFYFPVLLTIKTPLAILGLLGLALLGPGRRLNLALGLAAVLFLFSFNIRVQIGIRFLLPLLAFLIVGLAVRTVAVLEALPPRPRRVGIALATALVGTLLITDLRLWPDSLRYTNELWGGTEAGYRLVSDSNYDWGQGLPELARWHEEHPGALAVWYFGTDPRYPDIPRYRPDRDGLDAPVLKAGRLAVGASWLYGGYSVGGPDREMMLKLRQRTPVARTRTFLIFDGVAP